MAIKSILKIKVCDFTEKKVLNACTHEVNQVGRVCAKSIQMGNE